MNPVAETTEDECLITEYRKGNKSVAGKLYEKYFSKVYHKCLSFSKDIDEANDLTQDILVKTLEHLDDFKGESKFSTWLYSITVNHCIVYAKKKQRHHYQGLEEIENFSDPESDEYTYLQNEETYINLHNALNKLSQQERELIHLKYTMKLSIKEIQLKLDLSSSAVKMRLKRARSKVEKLYTMNLKQFTPQKN